MILPIRVYAIKFVVLMAFSSSAFAPAADFALVTGKVLTADANFSIPKAVAVQRERIFSVGSEYEIHCLVSSRTKMIDLQGKTLIPGLIHNHVYFVRHALRWEHEARIHGVTSHPKALSIIAAKAKSMKRGEWVLTLGGCSPVQFRD